MKSTVTQIDMFTTWEGYTNLRGYVFVSEVDRTITYDDMTGMADDQYYVEYYPPIKIDMGWREVERG